ncbi:MAG TPA: MotA/TolQ/ExbB proton channel family protein, partial [Lacipirellulaceae bacterium]|nr:MotA/TolQ/ExbB proton channel family protein [Lacipirellulaceae bacterium]
MNATGIMELMVALAIVAGALAAFNKLVGKSPRGTLWLLSAAILTWASMLPMGLRDPDGLPLPHQIDLLVAVLRMCGAVGLVVGFIDLFQRRESDERHPLAQFVVKQPLVWGVIVVINFFALLFQGAFHSPLLSRYCARHPIEIIEMTVFFIGLAALVLRFFDTAGQFPSLRVTLLPPVPAGGQRLEECEGLLARLAERAEMQHTYIVRRLRDAIEFVRRKNSAAELDQHLRHLEELESTRINAAYSIVRIIIWAIPILGLLGTVIGITIAVANLNPETLEQSMTKVTHGLGVAFDHTATALSLTMILMFVKAGIERLEDSLLGRVDERVNEELVGRFQRTDVGAKSNDSGIERMSGQVVDAIESLAERQAEIWKSTIDGAHDQWLEVSVAAATSVKSSLTDAVAENLTRHAKTLNDGAQKFGDRLERSASQHAELLERSSQQTAGRMREGLERLAELLIEALERHGQIMTANEKELAEQNRQHLSDVQAALGTSMVGAAERQENLIRQSEDLLKEMQIALVEAAGATLRQQEQLVRQGDVLLKVVNATGQIKTLEETLVQNLAAVQNAHNFEEMAINLSAA